ncbi:translocation/assembly module TamB domain-containing protein [Pseudooctadecabacter sp.]|uniref:translocation/assembly module TamB domain-containing protein n=1 Tax=Pseudooctadecabacter sp. TaxID=1966338 RepID=UPI0025EF7E82|nr:translocation/assembly module TamB domain-containing protein [Pseudooctadecabacter sp.]
MRYIFLWAAVIWAALAPPNASAQTNEDDRSFITGLIEDAINNDELTVRLIGFEGALSSQATAQAITIADPDGVWLRMEDLVFDWNRSALLAGRVEIETLSAEVIDLIRLPTAQPGDEAPTAEATPFALPELPVSVDIREVLASEIILTEALLGEPVRARFEGSLTLKDGVGDADILLERIDAKTGFFDIEARFASDTRELALLLRAEEGENGIAARLLNLPDRPSVALTITGDAPLDDFVGNIALATDGIDRVTGTAQLSRPSGTVDQVFKLDLSGDLQPLLADQYDRFFGVETRLTVEGTAFGTGGLRLSDLTIASDQLNLQGSAQLDAQNWPERIDLRGRLGTADGTRVLLPVSGPSTEVSGMSLNVQYDVNEGNAWTGSFDITSLRREGLAIDTLALSGGGIIEPGAGAAQGRFSADLTYAARGLALDDPALEQAIGRDIEGTIDLGRIENEPFVVNALTLVGAGIEAAGTAIIDGPDNRFATRADLTISAQDFSRFAALSGLDLRGEGTIDLEGTAQPFDGIFDFDLRAQTRNLALGLDQVDPLLTGLTQLSVQAQRDTTGITLRGIDLSGDALKATGRAAVSSNGATATFDAQISDIGLIVPDLSGAVTLDADVATDAAGVISLTTTAQAPDADARINAQARPVDGGYDVTSTASVSLAELGTYDDLAGRPLSGGASVDLDGRYNTATGAFLADVDARTDDVTLGMPQVDPLLAGTARLTAVVEGDEDAITLRQVDLDGDAVQATGNGTVTTAGQATATFVARLTDLGLIAPQLSGPAVIEADVSTDEEGTITLSADADAPQAQATVNAVARQIDGGYDVNGDADLSVNDLRPYGALAGQSLSGGVSVDVDGRYNTVTGALQADVDSRTRDIGVGTPVVDRILAGLGRVNADVSLSEAGRLRLDALDAVFPNLTVRGDLASSGADTQADLSVRLRDVALLASDFSGPLVADITARQDAGGWTVSGTADGPAGTSARASGRVSNSGQLDLDVSGSAPLALANLYIAPRQINGRANFDLSVNGPPALSSVRGPVRIVDARLAAPTLGQAIENLNGALTLAGGTLRIDLAGQSSAGGDVTVTGPVDLASPFQAALRVGLSGIVLRDPNLYRTTADGAITVDGPLAGGARIAGRIDLGAAEIQVPTTGASALGSLPQVTHLGPRTDVRTTLQRAGVGVQADSGGRAAAAGPAYPLDLLIRAPSQIFVRGRGLDAELGGQLRLTGTTNAVIPVGRFDLVRGRLSILGQRFELDEGFAQLQGDFSPFLRLVARTETQTGTIVSIVVEGEPDTIDVRFESTPDLPQDEVLAQLLFGRDLSSISPLQAVQLASAVATLAGSGNGGVINSFRQDLDLDDLDIITDEEGNAAVRAGKYLSENVYTDVTVGAGGTSEINLNIDIDRNFTARGTVTSDGETSVGIFFERDY